MEDRRGREAGKPPVAPSMMSKIAQASTEWARSTSTSEAEKQGKETGRGRDLDRVADQSGSLTGQIEWYLQRTV